jgi:hypothetical protein
VVSLVELANQKNTLERKENTDRWHGKNTKLLVGVAPLKPRVVVDYKQQGAHTRLEAHSK